MDLAYCFMTPYRGIDEDAAGRLEAAIDAWKDAQPDSSLTYEDLEDRVTLVNTRAAFPWQSLELRDAAEIRLFRLLDKPRSPGGLAATLREAGHTGPAVTDEAVAALIGRWTALGLLFHDAGHVVHVATEADNQLLMRLQQRFARRADWWHADRRSDEGEKAGAGYGTGDGRE